jgi:Uma2 family endonuclease
MSAAIIEQNIPAKEVKKGKRLIKIETFLEKYTNRDNPFKYEWNNGIIEKKEKTINRDQTKILQKLMRLFTKTKAYALGGELINEVDMYMTTYNRTRRADIVYMTSEQVEESSNGEPTVCPFVMEVISKNDQVNEVGDKTIEYFENGVEVLWIIYPKLKKVEVYTSLDEVKICYGESVCSAAPVLPDFQIAVKDLLP